MADRDLDHVMIPADAARPPLGRRRFLAGLMLLAGAGAFAPFFRTRLARRVERIEVGRTALGTWVRVVVQDEDPARASRAAERAFAAIGVVDAQMSIHRADSEVSAVNAAAGRGLAKVDPAVIDVIESARDAAGRTGGVYDPTVLPLMRLYGFYGSGRGSYPSDRLIGETIERTGYRHLIVDRAAGRLGLAKRGAGIDLGSIGKGWALDRAVDALKREGIGSALVDVGGNAYGLGVPEHGAEGWSVGVLHPVTGAIARMFILRDAAVATSGNAEQFRMLGRVRVGHLFDARRGRPASGHLSASVLARTGVESDVGSTVAFLLGPDRFGGFPGVLDRHFID